MESGTLRLMILCKETSAKNQVFVGLAKPTMKTLLNTSTGSASGVFHFKIEIHKAVFLDRLLFCESNSKITFRISANAIGNLRE